jgi:predicted permease
MSWFSRFSNVFRAERVADDLDDEQQFHLESTAERLVAEGMSPEAARLEARRRFGNAGAFSERSRDVKLLPWVDAIVKDTAFGVRMLRKDAVASSAAVISLGLAMGACAAAFMLVDALILRPLPVQTPERLIYLAMPPDPPTAPDGTPRREGASFSYPLYERLRDAAAGKADLMVVGYQRSASARFADAPDARERVRVQFVSGQLFDRLGVVPSAGRVLRPDDDRVGASRHVAVLSHAFWRRRFGGHASVIGRVFTLERDKQYEIVGVAREGFTGVEPGILTDIWVPATTYNSEALTLATGAGWQWFRIWGLLEPGVTGEEAVARVRPVFRRFREERVAGRPADSPRDENARYIKQPLVARSAATGPSSLRVDFERPLLILAAVVGLVLLLACSNVANLLLGRAVAREREMALRLSIGAGRGRLMQQLLIESAVLASAATALAIVFASLTAPLVVRLLTPLDEPAYLDLQINTRVGGFLLLLGVATTIVFGLVPAIRASGISPIDALKATSRQHVRARRLQPLLTAQVAFSLAVLTISGLLLFSFARLSALNPGFRTDGLVLAELETADEVDGGIGRRAVLEALSRVRAMSEVSSASASAWALLRGHGWMQGIRLPGGTLDGRSVNFLDVSTGFFETMGMTLRAGRDLSASDLQAKQPSSVVVNEAFVREYFPEGRALGRRFERANYNDDNVAQEIVGVVSDAKYESLRGDVTPTVYVALRERTGGTLQIQTSQPVAVVTSRLRAELGRMSPAMVVKDVLLQSTIVTNTMLRERLLALLSGFFGVVSLVLAAVGLYGVLSYSVVQRTREIGIRRALGAGRLAAGGRVLGDVTTYGALGLVLGTLLGGYCARFVRGLLFGVEPFEPLTLAAPIVVLLLVGALAATVPARRAASVDPMVALREE